MSDDFPTLLSPMKAMSGVVLRTCAMRSDDAFEFGFRDLHRSAVSVKIAFVRGIAKFQAVGPPCRRNRPEPSGPLRRPGIRLFRPRAFLPSNSDWFGPSGLLKPGPTPLPVAWVFVVEAIAPPYHQEFGMWKSRRLKMWRNGIVRHGHLRARI